MSSKPETEEGKKGSFFRVNLGIIKLMMSRRTSTNYKSLLEVEEVIAYIVLSRGAGRFDSSGWTDNAIYKYSRMSVRRAEQACLALEEHGFISRNPNYCAVKKEKNQTRDGEDLANPTPIKMIKNSRHKYILCDRDRFDGQSIYLPNSIVDGVDENPKAYPLSYFSELTFVPEKGISLKVVRLDALYLLLILYLYHDLKDFGGVYPNIYGRLCTEVEEYGGLGGSSARRDLGDTGMCIQEVILGEEIFSSSEVAHWFDDIADNALRTQRIEFAFDNLRASTFIYEVLQVWAADENPEVNLPILQYPLYVTDTAQQRAKEPMLAKEINKLAFAIYADMEIFIRDEEFSFRGRGQFRFIGISDDNYFLAGSLRLRYRAHDHDTGVGMKAQSDAVKRWGGIVQELKENAHEFMY